MARKDGDHREGWGPQKGQGPQRRWGCQAGKGAPKRPCGGRGVPKGNRDPREGQGWQGRQSHSCPHATCHDPPCLSPPMSPSTEHGAALPAWVPPPRAAPLSHFPPPVPTPTGHWGRGRGGGQAPGAGDRTRQREPFPRGAGAAEHRQPGAAAGQGAVDGPPARRAAAQRHPRQSLPGRPRGGGQHPG